MSLYLFIGPLEMAQTYQFWTLPKLSERTSFKSLQLQQAASIPAPGPGEVLVKVMACALNYRDLSIATGKPLLTLYEKEVIPVSDGADIVVDIGDTVTTWARGDRVASIFNAKHLQGSAPDREQDGFSLGGGIDGMLSQYRVVSLSDIPLDQLTSELASNSSRLELPASTLVRLPAQLTYEEASTLPCAAVTAWNSLFGLDSHRLQPGETVVCQGTGGVSVAGAQIAIAAGATVVITSSSDDKLSRIKTLFSREQQARLLCVNYQTNPDWDREVLRISGGVGASHILDVGGPGTITKAFASVKLGGVVSNIGIVAQGSGEMMPDVSRLVLTTASIYRGMRVGSKEQFEALIEMIDAHGIKPLIDRVFPVEEAVEAYEYLSSGKHVGKVVIKLS